MTTDTRLGMYICTGCDIGSSLNVEKLTAVVTQEKKIPVCKTHQCLCNPEGIKLIQSDIKNEQLTGIGIAACSHREKKDAFTFDKKLLIDRINLREQVVWCHTPQDEETQMMAEDYIRMGIAKLQNMKPCEAYITDVTKRILVVGGGISGLTAAIETARAGYEIALVEKEAELGGWMRKNFKTFPKNPPYSDIEDSDYPELVRAVQSHSQISLYLSSTIERIAGQPGQFEVSIKNGGASQNIQVGAIIQATGWRPYNAGKLGHLGYGKSPNVITNVELEEMASAGKIQCPSDGKGIESIVFIQCAGSRDPDHLPYCSSVCCNVAMKQVQYIRNQYPEAKIYFIYKDIRTPQQHELFYINTQKDERVYFTKGEIVNVDAGENNKIIVDVDETLIGESIRLSVDMVVLATGMVPTTLIEESEDYPENSTPKEKENSNDEDKGASAEVGAKILNLEYRLGTDLPTLKYGFPDSHYICFPYETRRTGIYAAGCIRAPLDAADSAADAGGAALKAIQAVECTAGGEAVHPRSGDLSIPDFFLQRCTQCKRCTEECPFGTLDEDEKGTPELNVLRCRRCGICLGACPERIVNFPDYSIEMTAQMIKSIDMPDEEEEKIRILVLACENDAYPLFDIVGRKRMQYASNIRVIPVRCLGSVNVIWIGDSLASGFDGILLLGCKYGDDYQCHYIHGSELANKRMENVQDKLKQLVLEPERVKIEFLSFSDWEKVPDLINDYVEEITEIGMNPYKGM